jgi:hypothetical protein
MQAMWSVESDDNDIDGLGAKFGDKQELNLALMEQVKEGPSTINIDGIIVRKNISNSKIIELLRNIIMSKNKELKSQ